MTFDDLGKPVHGWDFLGFNRAAPVDLLIRLLDIDPSFVSRQDLPPAVLDAAVDHPDRNVRGRLAEFGRELTADQWTRLALAERSAARRALFVEIAADRGAPLTDPGYEKVAADTSPLVRAEAARLPGLPAPLLHALAADPAPAVRAAACAPAWPHLPPSVRDGLLTDPDEHVRTAALLRHHHDHPLDEAGFERLGGTDGKALDGCRLVPALTARLAVHEDRDVRERLAENPRLDPAAVAVLAEDEDEWVRQTVAVRADLTEEQRAAVRVDIEPGARHPYVVPWVAALHDDPDAMRRLAASSHPFVRSSVARARRLPPDVVERLARDEDRVVRLFLAESCDDAPPDMLLEVWHWWDGSLSFPGRPRTHPDFPRAGLLRYATDPNPRLRRLALSDPESTAELVEAFSRDASEEVRQDAAEDPRLAPESAVRLLGDPEGSVRARAARNPALPQDVLLRLLRDRETAYGATVNPALPVPVMERMADLLAERVAERLLGCP
ncbi:PE-PGRS family protein [Streptomyces sp. P9(2023)]|uniref:PE-PGRS family protein n=1 Tax=Streptomyces sp. P9(2023) TaxID=3064394 RepID=UPI0028F4160A|nr:PE-PGRS family protein [Streptomyces sp. P9(2023)]MDT9687836.1 PE-PGRS family protein [Streptomyces sp. P9(2023)]